MQKISSSRYAGQVINGPVTGNPIKFNREGVASAEPEDVLKLINHPKGYYSMPEGEAEALSLDGAIKAFVEARKAIEAKANALEVAAAEAAAVDRARAESKLEAVGLNLAEILGEDKGEVEEIEEAAPPESKEPEPDPEPKVAAIDAEIDAMHHSAARALAKKLGGDPQNTDEARLFLKQQSEAEVRAALEEARG